MASRGIFFLCVIIISASKSKEVIPSEDKTWPEIYLLGAQKAGTTSLYSLLVSHPQICSSRCRKNSDICYSHKEIHFFDNDARFRLGAKAYLSQFDVDRCKHGKYLDATPDYIFTDSVPKRMESVIPSETRRKLKLIVILREPIARDYSYYEHLIRHCKIDGESCGNKVCRNILGKCKPGFASSKNKYLKYDDFTLYRFQNSNDSINHGKYMYFIKNYLKVFERKQLFILSFVDLIKNTTDIMYRLKDFLELSKGFGKKVELPILNEGAKEAPPMSCKMRGELAKHYKESNLELYDFLLAQEGKPHMEPNFSVFDYKANKCI